MAKKTAKTSAKSAKPSKSKTVAKAPSKKTTAKSKAQSKAPVKTAAKAAPRVEEARRPTDTTQLPAFTELNPLPLMVGVIVTDGGLAVWKIAVTLTVVVRLLKTVVLLISIESE